MAVQFGKAAEEYSLGRPDYPEKLFQLLDSLTTGRELVWDVGTGTGQAAVVLAERFKRVVATDIDEQQLELAAKRPNISYVKTSEQPTDAEILKIVGQEGPVDLITVAEAIHWFDLDVFYAQAKRLLRKPGGVLAAWCYPRKPFVNEAVDKVYDAFDLAAHKYWSPNLAIIENGFKALPFPFEAVDDSGGLGVGPIEMETVQQMSYGQYLLYLRSLSAVIAARSEGIEVLNEKLEKRFLDAWGSPDTKRRVKYKVFLVAGKVPTS